VAFARRRREAGDPVFLTARGGGAGDSGGCLCESIVVSLRNLNKIRAIEAETALVEAGVDAEDLSEELLKHNLSLPCLNGYRGHVGGIIAENFGGEKSLKFGKAGDFVKSLSAVLRDGEEHELKPLNRLELDRKLVLQGFEGEIYRRLFRLLENNYALLKEARPKVPKNSAGYALWDVWDRSNFDLSKLFIGSQGTLGFITAARVKLVRPLPYSRSAVVYLERTGDITSVAEELLSLQPESLEGFDGEIFNLAFKFPEMISGGPRLPALLRTLLERKMILTGRIPKMVFLASFASSDMNDIEERLRVLRQKFTNFGLSVKVLAPGAETQYYHSVCRRGRNLLSKGHREWRDMGFVDDVIVPVEKLSEFIPRFRDIFDSYPGFIAYGIAGHLGEGNLQITALADFANPKARLLIPEISQKVFDLVMRYGGSITAERNDGLARTPYLPFMFGPKIIELFAETKRIFDPIGLFNPGKKTGGDLKYSFEHLVL
jgi:FAD/FMN-containing dehydrogenase